jgi:hypothetical protein
MEGRHAKNSKKHTNVMLMGLPNNSKIHANAKYILGNHMRSNLSKRRALRCGGVIRLVLHVLQLLGVIFMQQNLCSIRKYVMKHHRDSNWKSDLHGCTHNKADNSWPMPSVESKLYTNFEFCEEKKQRWFKKTLIYKAKQNLMKNKSQEKSTYFNRQCKWCASRWH